MELVIATLQDQRTFHQLPARTRHASIALWPLIKVYEERPEPPVEGGAAVTFGGLQRPVLAQLSTCGMPVDHSPSKLQAIRSRAGCWGVAVADVLMWTAQTLEKGRLSGWRC